MFRIFFIVFLFLTAEIGLSQPADSLSLFEKEVLLDKAQTALLWFRALGGEEIQNRTAPEKYREQISAAELLQAAALVNEYKIDEENDLADELLQVLEHYRLTPEEMLELQDELGNTVFPKLAGVNSSVVENIPMEAQRFRTELLNNAEKVVLYDEPANALELMEAVEVLSVVGRPVLVRHYLRKILNDEQYNPSPKESATIVETIGTQKLMQIAVHPEFTPIGKEAVAKIIDEAKKHWQDQAAITEALKETNWLIERTAAVPLVRPDAKSALHVLWKGENLSVQQGFQKLKEIGNEQQADELSAVLLSLRPDMKEAFAAALNSENPTLRYYAARGLAWAVSPQEVFLLYAFLYDDRVSESERENIKQILQHRQELLAAADQEQAAEILHRRGSDYWEHRRPLRTDAEGKVAYWTYSEGNVEFKVLDNAERAYQYFADRYFEQSYRILPKDSGQADLYRTDFLIAKTEHLGALPENELKTAGEAESLLEKSLARHCFVSAQAILSWLAANGSADLLDSHDGKQRTLVQAVVAKDRRVRFAALSAIMQFKPVKPFAGSSLVADTLVWFANSDGQKMVLSGHPQMAIANRTASLFLGAGYQTDGAASCRELFEHAAASPDVELVVVDARTTQPPVGEFLQIMRQDARTAEIPIAVLSGNERTLNPERNLQRRTAMMRFDRRDPDSPFRTSLSLNYPRLTSKESAQWVRNDLLEKTGTNIVPPAERLDQARQSLNWLREIQEAELSESGTKIYHFDDLDSMILHTLQSEHRVEQGLALAAVVQSAFFQSVLYEMASNVVNPMKLREQAGKSFEQSIQTFGVLLRGEQIRRLYDRYNASGQESTESQELLSRLIDLVEERSSK